MDQAMTTDFFNMALEDKKIISLKMGQSFVVDQDNAFHIILGPCSSVILCGVDKNGRVWIGANHMIRAREKNVDMALKDISSLRSDLLKKSIYGVSCLGVFGGSYREESMTRTMAQRNIKTILETLSLFYLPVEVFETGYSQDILLLYSEARESFLIQKTNLEKGTKRIAIIPGSKILLQS